MVLLVDKGVKLRFNYDKLEVEKKGFLELVNVLVVCCFFFRLFL